MLRHHHTDAPPCPEPATSARRRLHRIALLGLITAVLASLTLLGEAAHWTPRSTPLAEQLPPIAARIADAAADPSAPPAAETAEDARTAARTATRLRERAQRQATRAAQARADAARAVAATKAARAAAVRKAAQRAAAKAARAKAARQAARLRALPPAARKAAQVRAQRAARKAAQVRAQQAARKAAQRRAQQAAALRAAAEARHAAEARRLAAAKAAGAEEPRTVEPQSQRPSPYPAGGWVKSLPILPALPTPDPAAEARAKREAAAQRAAAAKRAAEAKRRIAAVAAQRKAAAAAKARAERDRRAAAATAARIGTRKAPGPVASSHYLRTLRGGAGDLRAMRALGYRDARSHPSGHRHLVLLDIGGQTHAGVRLSATTRHITYRQLADAMKAYVDGYARGQRANAPAEITIGTNNDLVVTRRSGQVWADSVVDPVATHAKRYRAITVSGANDIEPGFAAGPGAVKNWVRGYLAATKAGLVFNGSADGCSPARPFAGCNRGWTMRDLAWVAGVAAPGRMTVLPQIYNRTMARQWAQIARTAATQGRPLRILGPLTETAACRGIPACPTMPSAAAWRVLWGSLNGHAETRTGTLPVQTDLDVR